VRSLYAMRILNWVVTAVLALPRVVSRHRVGESKMKHPWIG
jgi:hypothetical protein